MKNIFARRKEEMKKEGLLSRKTYILRTVQKDFALEIREEIRKINDRIRRALDSQSDRLDRESIDYIYSELTSNILELELNVNTIIMNFSRVTGTSIRFEEDVLIERPSIFRKAQLFFLLNQDSAEVYGQKLIYLEEEFKRELVSLDHDIDRLIDSLSNSEDELKLAQAINLEYFKINSDINTIIDDINSSIESSYSNVSSNRDMNINLSFLLISAFLSIILFFPEFNNMLNLKNEELAYSDKLDEIIYEKLVDQADLEELVNIRSDGGEDILSSIDDELLRDVIKTSIDFENEKLEKEKNRIRIFVTILLVILLPFLIWILFIAM